MLSNISTASTKYQFGLAYQTWPQSFKSLRKVLTIDRWEKGKQLRKMRKFLVVTIFLLRVSSKLTPCHLKMAFPCDLCGVSVVTRLLKDAQIVPSDPNSWLLQEKDIRQKNPRAGMFVNLSLKWMLKWLPIEVVVGWKWKVSVTSNHNNQSLSSLIHTTHWYFKSSLITLHIDKSNSHFYFQKRATGSGVTCAI